jgi:hypothetical protein
MAFAALECRALVTKKTTGLGDAPVTANVYDQRGETL